jgi:hypothetical protein
VALAASELVITSWLELTLNRPPASSDASQPSPELRRAAEQSAQRHFPRAGGTGYLLALVQAVGPFAGVGLGWGGGLRLGATSRGPWIESDLADGHPGGDLEITGSRSEVRSALGTIGISMWSAAFRGSLRFRRGRAWLDLGGGARLGLARLQGVPLDPVTTRGGTMAGTWAGPIAYAGVGIRFWRVIAAVGLEAGQVARSVEALVDEGSAVSISGQWLSGTFAMGWGE